MIDATPVADSLAHVITVGTPSKGVLLLSFNQGEISNEVVQTAVDAVGDLCGDETDKDRERLCDLFDAANAPAVTAMAPGSADLDALPAWGRGVIVDPIAADIDVRISALGFGTNVSLGDIVATVESAGANGSPGRRRVVIRCHVGIADLPEVVDRSPCSHANELSNRRVVEAVRRRVASTVGHATA